MVSIALNGSIAANGNKALNGSIASNGSKPLNDSIANHKPCYCCTVIPLVVLDRNYFDSCESNEP